MQGSRYTSEVRRAGVVVPALLLALSGGLVRGQSTRNLEYPVKAAILYNIAKFVEWPGKPESGDPLTFCVVGEDPFGHVLDETMRGKRINDRPVALRRCAGPHEFVGCQVLFIGASEKNRAKSLLRGLENTAVLTVSEIPGFAEDGGMINLVLENGKVRFEVNVEAVKAAGLRVRAQLLELARIVQPRGKGKG